MMRSLVGFCILMIGFSATATAANDATTKDYRRTHELVERWQKSQQPERHYIRKKLERHAASNSPYGNSRSKSNACQQYRQLAAKQAKQAEQLTPATDSQRKRLSRKIGDYQHLCKKSLNLR